MTRSWARACRLPPLFWFTCTSTNSARQIRPCFRPWPDLFPICLFPNDFNFPSWGTVFVVLAKDFCNLIRIDSDHFFWLEQPRKWNQADVNSLLGYVGESDWNGTLAAACQWLKDNDVWKECWWNQAKHVPRFALCDLFFCQFFNVFSRNEIGVQEWIPESTKCLAGQGLYSSINGIYVLHRHEATDCRSCPSGRGLFILGGLEIRVVGDFWLKKPKVNESSYWFRWQLVKQRVEMHTDGWLMPSYLHICRVIHTSKRCGISFLNSTSSQILQRCERAQQDSSRESFQMTLARRPFAALVHQGIGKAPMAHWCVIRASRALSWKTLAPLSVRHLDPTKTAGGSYPASWLRKLSLLTREQLLYILVLYIYI